MPNWAMNEMTITGTSEVLLAAIRDIHNGDTMTYDLLIPEPADADIAWRMEHWGCKWLPANSSVTFDGSSPIVATWDSPWCPPIPWLETLVAAHPEAEFHVKSGEPGMDVHLEWRSDDGQMLLTMSDDFGPHAAEWGIDDWHENEEQTAL